MVNKHFPKSVEIQKGHLKKQRQNVRSTKITAEQLEEGLQLTHTIAKKTILVKEVNASQTVYSE